MRYLRIILFLLSVLFISCKESNTAIIWTDHPELALYGELFNTVQSQYKVSVRYIEFPGIDPGISPAPDLVVASWLKNSKMDSTYNSLNNLFGSKYLSRDIFYPKLLAMGRIDRYQYLLPVSFNIPALVFSKERESELSNQFTINFDEIKRISRQFNTMNRGSYTRMGFSPLWNDHFLLTAALIYGAAFREDSPLSWDSIALERSMIFINNWTNEINSGIQAENDFTFKYFVEPPERLIQSGRIFFSFMESSDLFTLNEDIKKNLDFRWIMEQEMLPVIENSVYLGIPKKAKAKKAAEAFILWFYDVDNQRQLLEYSRNYRVNESIFGICGGFSALTQVTEQVYPIYYPELLGRMPPSENFSLQNILPPVWIEIKERVVLPYLHERARNENTEAVYPLERRLSDWSRLNR